MTPGSGDLREIGQVVRRTKDNNSMNFTTLLVSVSCKTPLSFVPCALIIPHGLTETWQVRGLLTLVGLQLPSPQTLGTEGIRGDKSWGYWTRGTCSIGALSVLLRDRSPQDVPRGTARVPACRATTTPAPCLVPFPSFWWDTEDTESWVWQVGPEAG